MLNIGHYFSNSIQIWSILLVIFSDYLRYFPYSTSYNFESTTFTLKFKETVGASPMEYLTRWRMMLAGDRLANTGDPVSTIALSVGYESESAFSTAFKRIMGCAPRQYARSRNTAHEQAIGGAEVVPIKPIAA